MNVSNTHSLAQEMLVAGAPTTNACCWRPILQQKYIKILAWIRNLINWSMWEVIYLNYPEFKIQWHFCWTAVEVRACVSRDYTNILRDIYVYPSMSVQLNSVTVKPLVQVAPNPKVQMFLVSSCSCFRSIHWSQVLSWEWRCSWSSADTRCSNYIWVINNFIAY